MAPKPESARPAGRAAVSRSASMNFPAWLWGGHPEGLATSAALNPRVGKDGALEVQTNESHLRRARPGLVDDAVA
ncbi:hypothetical protein [Cellulomonas sp. PhB150]|uniref:hypothetical protein n=1 Tax=Cellulomonas sp. PhB150 TaxID=2485188 RepID=UPI0011CE8384|nr:hypothetical protein [Cellulomonas sp. PhB150]